MFDDNQGLRPVREANSKNLWKKLEKGHGFTNKKHGCMI